MKEWVKDNADKFLLFALVVMFFGGAFVSAKFGGQGILAAALDNLKFVLGALVGLITGVRIAKGDSVSKPD